LQGTSDQVVATATQQSGNTVFTLQDGTTLTFIGTLHVDAIVH
jgi:hypothetical protein